MNDMKKIIISLLSFCPFLAFGQLAASYEDIYEVAQSYSQKILNQRDMSISFVSYPTVSIPLYEVAVNEYTLIISSEKSTPPVLMVIKNDDHSTILNNPNLPDGLQYFLEKYCWQIKYAMDSMPDREVHPQWTELRQENSMIGENVNMNIIIEPLLTTAWGQDRPNIGNDCSAYNYFVSETNSTCECSEHQCATGCVATAMAQIMRYWNYPIFRAGKKTQYDWCNMPDSLNQYFTPFYSPNPNYAKQRNSIARLMADCGDAADMHYCCHGVPFQCGCQSFAWPVKARDALADSFQYSSNAVHRLRSSYLTQPQTWKNFLIQDLQNGRPLIYAGASYATGGYEQSGHAFVCDGYKEGTDLFHFNWGWNGSYYDTWCALDAIIIDNCNYNHLERAVFNIYPSTNENYCDFDLELYMHYLLYYNPFVTSPHPYQNVPPTATRLYSVPISVPNGSGTYYFDDSLRTIPSGAISEYVAHKEIVLRPGFTAENGCNFVARIEPCAECEEERGQSHHAQMTNAAPRGDAMNRVSTDNITGLRLHPNPTTHTLTVESASPIRTLTVYDLAGRVMMALNGGDTISVMDVSSLPNGIYLLRAVTDNGVETGRFVKN